MKRSLLMVGILAAMSVGTAWAQPEAQPAPIAPNPPNANAALTPEQQAAKMEEVMKKAQAEGLAIMKLPPDQMMARLRQMQMDALRLEMDRMGFKDKTLQDRIVKFIDDQEKSRQEVRTAGMKVLTAMTAAQAATTDQTLTGLLEDYLGAVDEAKAQRAAASGALDNEIGWSRQPRLRAFLTLKGFVGEDAWIAEDSLMAGNMSLGTMAGFGKAPGR